MHIPAQYIDLLQSREKISWGRMMEGMLSKELLLLSRYDILSPSSKLSQPEWVKTLIQKLLEATHGVWIYRNITMHDKISGLGGTKEKEQLIQEIELQIERGGEGLAEQDKWMLEIDLEKLESSSGERKSYWLIAIQTACMHYNLAHQESADLS